MSLPSKDNLTNATSTDEIDWYFSLTNPSAKKRHIIFFSIGSINALMILIFIFQRAVGLALFLWIGIILIFILATIYMVWRKNSYYRFIIYLLTFGGLYCSGFLFSSFPLGLIVIIASVLFLINFISIDLSLQRHLNWFVRRNKMNNNKRFGYDNIEEN